MNEREIIIELYDLYKEVFTKKQREYFEYYYFEDMSLAEVSENLNVSRTVVAKTVNNVENKLKKLEEGIRLLKIKNEILNTKDKELIEKINKIIYK